MAMGARAHLCGGRPEGGGKKPPGRVETTESHAVERFLAARDPRGPGGDRRGVPLAQLRAPPRLVPCGARMEVAGNGLPAQGPALPESVAPHESSAASGRQKGEGFAGLKYRERTEKPAHRRPRLQTSGHRPKLIAYLRNPPRTIPKAAGTALDPRLPIGGRALVFSLPWNERPRGPVGRPGRRDYCGGTAAVDRVGPAGAGRSLQRRPPGARARPPGALPASARRATPPCSRSRRPSPPGGTRRRARRPPRRLRRRWSPRAGASRYSPGRPTRGHP